MANRNKFNRLKRKEGEDMQTFVNRFNMVYNNIKRKETTISDSPRVFILVQKAGISEEQKCRVIYFGSEIHIVMQKYILSSRAEVTIVLQRYIYIF